MAKQKQVEEVKEVKRDFTLLPVFEQVNELRQRLILLLQEFPQISIMIFENYTQVNVRFTVNYPPRLFGLEVVVEASGFQDISDLAHRLAETVKKAIKNIEAK